MEAHLWTYWVFSHYSHFPLTCSLSGYGPFTTLVTSYIWPGRWPYSRAIIIYTPAAPEINLHQSLVGRLLNWRSVCLRNWRLVLILFFAGSRFPLLWIHKIMVFSRSLFCKGLIGYEILLWYEIHVTHTIFLDKFCNHLVILNSPQIIRSAIKRRSGIFFHISLYSPCTMWNSM